jgi:hypothetical protein
MAENFERRICFVLRRQILEDWLWQSLTICKHTATQLNDWKNAPGFRRTLLTRLLHSGFIREKSEQNDGVAVLEESGGSVPIGARRVLQNRLQEDP